MWTFGVLKLLCETPAAPTRPGRRGSHTTARELKTCTFQSLWRIKNPTKNSTKKTQKRGRERMKTVAGEGKKSAKFWAPHPSGPHPSVPPPFRCPTLRGPTLLGLGSCFFCPFAIFILSHMWFFFVPFVIFLSRMQFFILSRQQVAYFLFFVPGPQLFLLSEIWKGNLRKSY